MHIIYSILQRYKEPLNANSQKDFYIPHYDSQPMHIRPRTSTVILYLEEPEKGGETILFFFCPSLPLL